MADPILKVENVDLGYGTLKVVFDVSLEVGRGELVGLVGGNGSGKSTILRAISGMIAPWSGRIVFDGEELRHAQPHQMAEKGLAHVPMGRQLFANMTVHDNLMLGAYLPAARARRADNLARVHELFPELLRLRDAAAAQLSGGQQQMVAVARAAILRPRLLLADEPTGALHSSQGELIMDLLAELNRDGTTILQVTHNPDYAARGTRVVEMRDGRLQA